MVLNDLAECIHENKVCSENNNETHAEIRQKSNYVLSFLFSKVRAVGIEFCNGETCNFKSASR